MSSTKNDLFGDSSSSDGSDGGGDTDDLIAAAKSQPIATKKKSSGGGNTSSKKKKAPDADNDSDDDDDSDDDEDFASPEKESGGGGGGGLFDSSSEDDDDDDDEKPSKKKRKTTTNSTAPTAKKLSSKKNKGKKSSPTKKLKKDGRTMKEKMEELAKKKRQAAGGDAEKDDDGPRRKRSKPASKGGEDGNDDKKKEGYESGDSYDSKTFARTKEDDDFIDADDEDPEALKELYAEQHFDDERPDGSDSEDEKKKKKVTTKKKTSSSGGGVDKISLSDDEGEGPSASSALKDAVRRMQKKKKEVKKLPQLEQEASTFLQRMDVAADMDEESIAAKKPALKKLGMLSEVMEMLAQKDMQRVLLDLDLLMVCKRWIQPLPPDGKTLGNVTVRRRIIESLSNMTGESGINSTDLKRSGFGKVVMALYKHKSETPELKKMLKTMIEQWSRPIFQKSGNMRDLERAQMVRGMNEMGSLVGIARQQQQLLSSGQKSGGAKSGGSGGRGGRATDEDDLAQIINHGSKNTNDIGNNRVRVPFSKGFQFSVRPADRTGDVSDKRNLVSAKAARGSMGRGEEDKKDSLQKRMASKARPTNKQSQRSANISIEGRVVK
jgi:transcription factor SPN1